MKYVITSILGIAFVTSVCVQGAIYSPGQRAEKLGIAEAIVSLKIEVVDKEIMGAIGNPFSLDRFPELEEEEFVAVRIADDEVLSILSPYVVPTGVFLVNGEYIAMFQGKQVRNGDSLSVVYEGEEYNIVINDIDRVSFEMSYGESNLKVKLK